MLHRNPSTGHQQDIDNPRAKPVPRQYVDAVDVVLQMLKDEALLNDALETCRVDYSHQHRFGSLKYSLQVGDMLVITSWS